MMLAWWKEGKKEEKKGAGEGEKEQAIWLDG